jgi:hypothetical protein
MTPRGAAPAGAVLKAAVHLLAGRSTAVETTKKIMEDFERLMDTGGDPAQSAELLKPEVCPIHLLPRGKASKQLLGSPPTCARHTILVDSTEV